MSDDLVADRLAAQAEEIARLREDMERARASCFTFNGLPIPNECSLLDNVAMLKDNIEELQAGRVAALARAEAAERSLHEMRCLLMEAGWDAVGAPEDRLRAELQRRQQADAALAAVRAALVWPDGAKPTGTDAEPVDVETRLVMDAWQAVGRALAAERAKRCGTCADARRFSTKEDDIKCVSDASPCYGWQWPADHGCPAWRQREEGR